MRKLCLIFIIPLALYSVQGIVVDPYFSPFSGAYNIRFAHWVLEEVCDYLSDDPPRVNTRGAWKRFIELLLWGNINRVADVTQHEVFGHGYRLRELGVKPTGYSITPWGGWTSFYVAENFKAGNLLAITVAGLEAEAILARQIKMAWMQKGAIDGRTASLYTQAEQSLFWYTLITSLGQLHGEEASEGNDVLNYLTLLNDSYPQSKTSLGTLTRISLLNWLDPMTFYGYYSWFYYIALGKPWAMPMISLKEGIDYLPNVRIGYAPYAPEFYFENFFVIKGQPLYSYIKGGKRSVGAGVEYDHLLRGEQASLGICLDGWYQNKFVSNATVEDILQNQSIARPSLNDKIWGVAGSVTAHYKIRPAVELFAEVGGKTSGYLPGYQLSGGAVGRVGIMINPSHKGKD